MPLKKVIRQAAFVFGRRALSLWLAALALVALPARGELRFDAFLGYDNILPERSWFPITCEIFNDGPAFNATVEVTAQDFGQGQTRRLTLDLPTNTRKRITIPVFATAQIWNVRLLDERGKVRAEQQLRPFRVMKSGLPLIAALARTVGGVPVLPDSPSVMSDDSKYGVARLQTSLFPDNPLALEGMDVLYLSSEKAADLSVGQVNALMAWLHRGGHLIVGVEQLTDVNATPWLRELLPMTLTSIVSVSSHESLEEWAREAASPMDNQKTSASKSAESVTEDVQFGAAPMQAATGEVRDGKVLLEDSGTPWVVQGNRGRGKITVLTFSPEREPFLSWKNREWFWSRVAEVPAKAYGNPAALAMVSRLSTDGIFRAMIDTKQVRKLPLGWLLALLVAYLVVIGPLDQYWLKKINRQMLTWVTFPCYVVFFSALIYFIGFHLRAGELEWNELSVVDILPNDERAVLRGQTYISIYSPNNAHYELASRQKFASLRGEYLGNFGGNQEGSRAVVDQTGNNYQADAFVPVWTSELFVSDWVEPSALPLDMKVERSQTGWDVTVTNSLDRPLTGMRAVLDGRVYILGDVAAGQAKTVTVKTAEGTLVSEMARQYGDRFRRAVEALHQSFGNNADPIADAPDSATAASFFSDFNNTGQESWNNFTGPSSLDLSRFADGSHAILLAWDAGYSPTTLNQFTAKRYHRDTVFRLVVPVKM